MSRLIPDVDNVKVASAGFPHSPQPSRTRCWLLPYAPLDVYEEPKAERSRRTLALPVQLVDALRARRAAELPERSTAGSLWEDHDLVFAQANGRPIERKSDWQAWKALLRDAGVREVRLHDGRHTAATLLPSEGVHPRVVMEVLGRDADRMGNALWGPSAP